MEENMYGRSLPLPNSQSYNVQTSTLANGTVTTRRVTITLTGPYGSRSFNLFVHLPTVSADKKVPVFLLINNRNITMGDGSYAENTDFFPVKDMLDRGYGMATFLNTDVAADSNDNQIFRNNLINIFIPSTDPLPNNGPRAISAWAYAASRCLDYLLTDELVDGEKVAVLGHSRGGKASLWAGACDERFAYVISNDSGNSGAALARSATGQDIMDLNNAYTHWFCTNYKSFNGKEYELPFDQHELIALIAPRMVQVASATLDAHSTPKNEFYALLGAQTVYDLYDPGYRVDLPATAFSTLAKNTLYAGGAMAYHIREGDHGLTKTDWKLYADFVDQAWLNQ